MQNVLRYQPQARASTNLWASLAAVLNEFTVKRVARGIVAGSGLDYLELESLALLTKTLEVGSAKLLPRRHAAAQALKHQRFSFTCPPHPIFPGPERVSARPRAG